MRNFCITFISTAALAAVLAVIFTAMYLDSHGPDWIVSPKKVTTQPDGSVTVSPVGSNMGLAAAAFLSLVAIVALAAFLINEVVSSKPDK